MLLPEQREELLRALKARFETNMARHKGLEWAKVQAKLTANAAKLRSLHEMERTGGEPDVVGHVAMAICRSQARESAGRVVGKSDK